MQRVKTGLEVLIDQRLDTVKGKRVGLATNHSAVTSDSRHIIDALHSVGVKINALYAPEHGIAGIVPAGVEVSSTIDSKSAAPVYSLYGDTKAPTPDMLEDIDVLVFDMQDVGCRYYTYIWTMLNVLKACAVNNVPMIVLDRPNPITGSAVEGNIPEDDFLSFVGLYPIPIRHGMTIGELALFFKKQLALDVELTVIPCQGWNRKMWFDETGLPWVKPSPGMISLDTAILYPGTCLVEGTNISEGRGTGKPFEVIGAPWIDGSNVAQGLNSLNLEGISFQPVNFTPTASKYEGMECGGIEIRISKRDRVNSLKTGLNVVKTIHDMYPKQFEFLPPKGSSKPFFDLLAGTDKLRLKIEANVSIDEILMSWDENLQSFSQLREDSLIYA